MIVEMYTTGREDLAKIIAQEISGVKGAEPEQDDYDLAGKFLLEIEGWTRRAF